MLGDIEIVELIDIDGEWHEKTDEGFIKFDKSVKSFPALLAGKQGEQSIYVVGKEGVLQILTKGYFYDKKICH